jgi:hypothetical protein
MKLSSSVAIPLVFLMVFMAGCQSMYYGTMEKFGVHKRDILVSRVKSARDSQEAAKKQFANALEQFKSVVAIKGGELEAPYNTLNAALQKSEAGAAEVRSRIDAVEDVSGSLFREWRAELSQYSDQGLRRASEAKLEQTMARYDLLIAAMKRAESRIEPVLTPLRDQVLFLKHNLNAEAISSLDGELQTVQVNVDRLIREMESSIAEADKFIREMGIK